LSFAKAVQQAARERLRPILMTAISTIVGAVPLLISTGPGAAARQSLGTAIVGGMSIATVLSLFVVPVLYIVIKSAAARLGSSRRPALADGPSFEADQHQDGNGKDGSGKDGNGKDGNRKDSNGQPHRAGDRSGNGHPNGDGASPSTEKTQAPEKDSVS
jgi:hypothetical protein